VSPVMSRWLVPANQGGVGVGEGHVPRRLGGLFALLVGPGFGGRRDVGDEPVHDHRPAGVIGPGGELLVDPAGAGQREAAGLLGDAAGLPGRHPQGLDLVPQPRVAVDQVEGVADQGGGRAGGDPQPHGEGFGGERRHHRGAVPAQHLGGLQDVRLHRGGVQHGPLVGQRQLPRRRATLLVLGLGERVEHTSGVETAEVVDLERLHHRCAHVPTQAPTTDNAPASKALLHKGNLDRDALVILLSGRRRGRRSVGSGACPTRTTSPAPARAPLVRR
jgi:hypothetical protein